MYAISGCAGLAYETIWIRAFAISFGNTLLSFSTIVSVYLGGLALGAAWGARVRSRRALALYGIAEIWIGAYALAIPWLMDLSPRLLAPLYGADGPVALARALLCAAILLPATIPMGATLPWLVSWLGAQGKRAPRLTWIYAINTAGGAVGALLTGFVLLPESGYWRTLLAASGLDIAAGMIALWMAREVAVEILPVQETPPTPVMRHPWLVVFLCGWSALLYEVAWSRVAGLMFGPTAATVTHTLVMVILGLAAGAIVASMIRRSETLYLAASQTGAAVLLLGALLATAVSPAWLAEQIRWKSDSPARLEFLEAELLFLVLFPLMTAAGMALPLVMRLMKGAVGPLYGVNTVGCILGTLMTGWLLVPNIGTERTLYIGAIVNAALAAMMLPASFAWRAAASVFGLLAVVGIVFPRWDLAAMTAGAYKYAPYYSGSAAGELHSGEVVFLREGAAGTVTVRDLDGSRLLAIDGKVDATDAGADLLTEKLLAHLPLRLVSAPHDVCVIGLASGVSAGSALTYPVQRLDVVELSREVVQASHLFDGVNGKPLDDKRTHLILNDGRNHLALSNRRYDAILSEPSNPWISGMNSLFTREFFRIARGRLNPGGVLAQWFHLYNMPLDDLRSLLRSFVEVFPSAALWQLNEGDLLITGFADDRLPRSLADVPRAAAADLSLAGVTEPGLLLTLYVMRDADLKQFAGAAEANTDDRPLLEFHGQRNLHLQTNETNSAALDAFPRQVPQPEDVRTAWAQMTPERWCARGTLFETAESYRLAFESYRKALGLPEALSGMIRCARSPEERAAAGTLESRTEEGLAAAKAGNYGTADAILRAMTQAFPDEPAPLFNYGLFCLERARYDDALKNFAAAIAVQKDYIPAFEASAETCIRKRDFAGAAEWSRRILKLDPNHPVARQMLAAMEASKR